MQPIRPVPGLSHVPPVQQCSAGCCQRARPEGFDSASHSCSNTEHNLPILNISGCKLIC